MKKLFVAFLIFVATACATTESIKDSVRPQTAAEGFVYAQGTIFAIEASLVYMFNDPRNFSSNSDKAIVALIADKIAASRIKMINSAILDLRAGKAMDEVVTGFGPSPLNGFTPVTEFELYNKILYKLGKMKNALALLQSATDLSKLGFSECKLEIEGFPEPLACDVPSDYILMILLRIRD